MKDHVPHPNEVLLNRMKIQAKVSLQCRQLLCADVGIQFRWGQKITRRRMEREKNQQAGQEQCGNRLKCSVQQERQHGEAPSAAAGVRGRARGQAVMGAQVETNGVEPQPETVLAGTGPGGPGINLLRSPRQERISLRRRLWRPHARPTRCSRVSIVSRKKSAADLLPLRPVGSGRSCTVGVAGRQSRLGPLIIAKNSSFHASRNMVLERFIWSGYRWMDPLYRRGLCALRLTTAIRATIVRAPQLFSRN